MKASSLVIQLILDCTEQKARLFSLSVFMWQLSPCCRPWQPPPPPLRWFLLRRLPSYSHLPQTQGRPTWKTIETKLSRDNAYEIIIRSCFPHVFPASTMNADRKYCRTNTNIKQGPTNILKNWPALLWFNLKVKEELAQDLVVVERLAVWLVGSNEAFGVILIGWWLTVTPEIQLNRQALTLIIYLSPLL